MAETLLAVDNTWGCPGLYRPLALGADISIVAVTKYIAGHSDLVMGSVSAGKRCADRRRDRGRRARREGVHEVGRHRGDRNARDH